MGVEIRKKLRLPGGGEACISLEDGRLQYDLRQGEAAFSLRGTERMRCDAGSVAKPYTGSALLLGGRLTVEETETSLTLHGCPVDEENGAPVPALMVHYRFEIAGENALRVTTWFSASAPVPVNRLTWQELETDRKTLTACVGFAPDYRFDLESLSHDVQCGGMALCSPAGYVLLTDCGLARFTPQAPGGEGEAFLCMLSCGCTRGLECWRGCNLYDLAMLDETHPLSMILAVGVGKAKMPEFYPRRVPERREAKGISHTVTSGTLTMGILERPDGADLCSISLPDGGCAEPIAPLARLTVQNLETGLVEAVSTRQGWRTVRVRESGHRLSVYLDGYHDIPVALAIEAQAGDEEEIRWRTRVLNRSEKHSVLSVSYPGIGVAGGTGESLFLPSDCGRVVADAFGKDSRYRAHYPGGFQGTVPVFGLYQPDRAENRGLYIAVHDAGACYKEMLCALWQDGTGYFQFDYPAEHLGKGANSFSTAGWLIVRRFSGDWYDMANIYGAYLRAAAPWLPPMGREDSPQWMREVPMYVMDWMPNDNPDADPIPVSVRPKNEPPKPRDSWYQTPIRLAEKLGLPIGYHLYNWHWIPFNNDYPFYFPVKEGMKEGVAELEAHGVHVMPYINGRIVDTRDTRGENIRFDRDFRAGATKQPDGSLDIETYASHEPDGSLCRLAAMCPSAPKWRDTLSQVCLRLFEEYGVSAIYIDQVAAADPNFCCDPTHDHIPGNGDWWVKAYGILMERLRRECPEGRGFVTESNAEPYADQFDGFLTWAWVDTDLVPFFPKLYAGRIAMLGRNTNGYKKTDKQFCRYHIGQAVLYGQQIGWMNADVVDDGEKIEYLSRMCHARWEYRDWFSRGSMLRPPVITRGQRTFLADVSMGHPVMCPADTVLAGGWQLDSRVILIVTNTADEPAAVEAVYDTAEYAVGGAWDVTAYGEGTLLSAEPGKVAVNLGGQSCLVLTGKRQSQTNRDM